MSLSAIDALNLIRDELAKKQLEDVPDGWYTSDYWSEQWGKSGSTTQRFISDGCDLGVMEMRKFRVMTNRGIFPVPHYRIVEKTNAKKAAQARV